MADTLKILAQNAPTASTLTDMYTVAANTSVTVSSLVICNTSTQSATFRVSVAQAAAADTTKQYIYYDCVINANDTLIAVIGITLATTDVVRVYASSSFVSFSLFGVEIS